MIDNKSQSLGLEVVLSAAESHKIGSAVASLHDLDIQNPNQIALRAMESDDLSLYLSLCEVGYPGLAKECRIANESKDLTFYPLLTSLEECSTDIFTHILNNNVCDYISPIGLAHEILNATSYLLSNTVNNDQEFVEFTDRLRVWDGMLKQVSTLNVSFDEPGKINTTSGYLQSNLLNRVIAAMPFFGKTVIENFQGDIDCNAQDRTPLKRIVDDCSWTSFNTALARPKHRVDGLKHSMIAAINAGANVFLEDTEDKEKERKHVEEMIGGTPWHDVYINALNGYLLNKKASTVSSEPAKELARGPSL